MITISSKAGQRLARAKVRLEAEKRAHREAAASGRPSKSPPQSLLDAMSEAEAATDAVVAELIAGRHHEVEGD